MSFTNAAEYVLENYANDEPMHYRRITDKVVELGLVKTGGRTPEATLYSQVLTEVERARRRGETPRFEKPIKGMVGLTKWRGTGAIRDIEAKNTRVRRQLLDRLKGMDPGEFEELVSRLLSKMGFEDVVVTSYSKDGGIDVRGTHVLAGVVRTPIAIQVKRWRNNVHSPEVQRVRGSSKANEMGMIVTTSDFSPGARAEAAAEGKTHLALVNGEVLAGLLMEYEIGVRRTRQDVFELASDGEE